LRNRLIGLAITVVAAMVTLGLSRQLWPDPTGALQPPSTLLPFFVGLAVVESVLFGLGLCFLVFGFGLLNQSRQPFALTYATYASLAWLMLSWWPHDNLHRVTPVGDWTGLLGIEYAFHLTLMVASACVAVFVYRALRPVRRPAQ
jgi:hypothetical protein